MVEESRTPEASAWDRFLVSRRPDVGYKQSAWWPRVLSKRGRRTFEAVVGETEDSILGGARVLVEPFARDKCCYYVPHGPVLPADPAEAKHVFAATMIAIHLQRQSEKGIVSHVRLEPHWQVKPEFVYGFREPRGWIDPRETLRVDLAQSGIAILEQMKPKGRYNVRLAARKGVTVVEDRSERGFADFLALYRETFDRHGLETHSVGYMQRLRDQTFPFDRGTIFFAEYRGQRLSTAFVLYHGDTATYKYGGSSMSHRNVMAPYLLHYEIMLQAKARGHAWYDFYGMAPTDAPDHRFAGFTAFKSKFGGTRVSWVRPLEYVYDEDAYSEWRASRGSRSWSGSPPTP
jgi:lipid II:glycine glycyltransferase (peptidoglycan interpeptide bridge formation enzyme)